MSYGTDFLYTGSGMIPSSSNAHTHKAPIIAELLHRIPRFNLTLHRTNNTFRIRDEVYLESLGILGSVPAALLIVSLFGLLLYLMTRCCDRKPRTAHSITSLKVTLSVVTVLCCAAIGLGLYGNDDLHNGLLEVLTAGRKVDNLISSVKNSTNNLEMTLSMKIRPQLIELEDIFDQPTLNQTALKMLIMSLNAVQGNVSIANNAAGDIRRPLSGINMAAFLNRGDQWELIRWPGTVAVLALLLVLCAVLLVGVARHSRCALILFSVCGLLAVTGSWLMSGLYLSSSVAVADLCMDPADYLASEAPNELPTDVLLYYTQCEDGNINPFTLRLRESQNAINSARSAMSIVSRISMVLFKSAGLQPKIGAVGADLNTCERLLTQLTALVDCKAVYYNYSNATRGLCEGGLLGLVLMLAASFIAAILLTVMVWVDSHTWIYIRKRNDYAQVEEPSYVSHQPALTQQQQQQAQNHYHATMSRTLPRNMNNGPPVISGSHTLGRKHHEQMMMAQQQQQQQQHGGHHPQGAATMRPMNTHTLGRLPSHHHAHHSPQHMAGGGGGGPNNVYNNNGHHGGPAMDHQGGHASQTYQQMPHPSQMTPQQHQEYVAAMAKYAQQHQNYHQQQQQYQQSHHQHHYSDGHQIQLMQQQGQQGPAQMAPGGGPMTVAQQNAQNHMMTMRRYQTMQRPPGQQQQQQMPPQMNGSNGGAPPPAAAHLTGNGNIPKSSQSNNNQSGQPGHHAEMAPAEGIYERDKQGIYKCNTLRQGGRFDSGGKPSILNCPLPDIPKELPPPQQPPHQAMDGVGGAAGRQCKTMQRSHQHPHAKAIPMPVAPPRIVPSKAAAATDTTGGGGGGGGGGVQQQPLPPPPALHPAQLPEQEKFDDLPPPPPRLDESDSNDVDCRTQISTETSSSPTSSTATIIHQPNSLSQSSLNNSMPPPPLNGDGGGGGMSNDESNYAVTEL